MSVVEQAIAVLPCDVEDAVRTMEKLMAQQGRRAQHARVQASAAPNGSRKTYWRAQYVRHEAQRRALEAAILAVREACK